MQKRKNGAALIMVIIIFMVLSIVSVAMLSMVLGNYKARISESKRIENLYGSDSGLYVAHNIIVNSFNFGVINGQEYVKLLQNNKESEKNNVIDDRYIDIYDEIEKDIDILQKKIISLKDQNKIEESKEIKKENTKKISKYNGYINEDKNAIDKLENEVFKDGFIYIFEEKDIKNNSIFESVISNKQYINAIRKANEIDLKTLNYMADSDSDKVANLNVENFDEYLSDELENYTIDRDDEEVPFNISFDLSSDKVYKFKIKSDFQSQNKANIGYNNRSIEVNYNLNVPNYDEVYSKSTNSAKEYISPEDFKFIIGGNMLISKSNINVKDDIYVLGNSNDSSLNINQSNRGEKYKNGIQIMNESIVEFDKNVITRKTFNIQDHVNALVNGNIYAGNIYLGKINLGKEESADNSSLTVKDSVILDNDLTLNAENTSITMNNFYGINDKNITYSDGTISKYSERSYKEKSSSSIIINSNNDISSINILSSAYLMGTAYINTKDGYQTGESGAVKGNYIAYSVPEINDDQDNIEKLKIEEIENETYIQLLDEDNVFKKADHFLKYWNNKENVGLKSGGINWPEHKENKIFSIGAIVFEKDNKREVIASKYSQDLESENGEIGIRRKEFAKNSYNLGINTEQSNYESGNKIEVLDIMKLSNITGDYKLEKSMEHRDKYAIFNQYKDKTIKIKKTTRSEDSIEVNEETIDIYISEKEKYDKSGKEYRLDSFIVSDGDIIIEDDKIRDGEYINLNGNFIIGGNLITSNSNIEINYDSSMIKKIQSKNAELFKSVFGGEIINLKQNNIAQDSEYDINDFLKKKSWKIVR